MSFNWSDLFGANLLKGETEVSTNEALADKDAVAIYFSAHWCPPCRGFTPKFAENYKKLIEAGKKFETVFLSSDKDDAAFKEYYAEMPWLALSFDQRDKKKELSEKFNCSGIPYLVILDGKTGETITTNGRGGVSAEDFIETFPWHPKPVYDTSESMDGVYDGKCFMLIQNYADKDVIKANSELLTKFATENKGLVHKFFTVNNSDGSTPFIRKEVGLKVVFQKPDIAVEKMPDTSTAYLEMFGSKEGALSWACDICRKSGRDAKEQYHNKEKGFDLCEVCYEKPNDEITDDVKVPALRVLNVKTEEYWLPDCHDVTEANIKEFLNAVKEDQLTAYKFDSSS